MTDTDLRQPDLGPLRAAVEAAELAQAVSGLVSIDGCRLADSDPLAPPAPDIARSMTEAGLTVHHCAQHEPPYRLGGACLLASAPPGHAPPARPAPLPAPSRPRPDLHSRHQNISRNDKPSLRVKKHQHADSWAGRSGNVGPRRDLARRPRSGR